MDPTITRIVLPGTGPVCIECASRGHIPELPFSASEVYTFGITEPRTELDWDIDRALAMIAARPRTPLRLDPEWLRTWLDERTSVTAEHLDHIPSSHSDTPGILVEIMACPPGGQPEPFRMLIDGNHRAARHVRDGMDFFAYLLTEPEQRSICTYRLGGKVTEIPTFPGRGVDDQRAGVIDADEERLPEFDVTVRTVRSGTHLTRIDAADRETAHHQIEAELAAGQSHCPGQWCTDDVESEVVEVRQVVLDGVILIAADEVSRGTLYADDSLGRPLRSQS